MKKRWTAALLALCFVLSLAPYALAAEEPPGAPSAGTDTVEQVQTLVGSGEEEPAPSEVVTLDLSQGRVEITDTGYTQYQKLEDRDGKETPHTGAYILTGTLELTNYSTYKKTAVTITSESEKTFDITLQDLTVTLTYSYSMKSDQVFPGLIQVVSGNVNLNVAGENTLTVTMTGSAQPGNPAIAYGGPVIRVIKGNLMLTGDGTLTLNNQDENEDRDFSGGIQVHAGSLTLAMEGKLEIHVSHPTASHITCGELDYSNKGLPGMDAGDADQGNLLIQSGTIQLGGSNAGTLEPGSGITAGRKLEITGGTVTIQAENATLCAAAPGSSGDFGSLVIKGADTEVSVENSVEKDYYRAVAVKENLTIEEGAQLAVTASGEAKGIVVGETQAPNPYVKIGDCQITIHTASDCMELFCDLTIDDGASLTLESTKANGIHSWVDYNRKNGYPAFVGEAEIIISAKSNGILYQVSNDGSQLEFGNDANLTITKATTGIKSSADLIIGGNAHIDITGTSSGGIIGNKDIVVKDDASVKVLDNSLLSGNGIEAKGSITIDCAELVSSNKAMIGKGKGVAAPNITITNMDYVPQEEDNYYEESMGDRNQMFDEKDQDTTDAMSGTHSSPYLYVKRAFVTIQPANITVYMGGDGYDGVVDGTGAEPPATAGENGLPEPGFLFTVPKAINDRLSGPGKAEDLADYLTFTYGDGETTREWKVALYSDGATSTTDEDGIARYVYRMVPAKGQDPVRLTFTDKEGQEVVSDEFVFDEDCLNTKYTMALYLNQLDQGHVQANFSGIEGMEDCSYPIQLETGTLTVRGTTEEPASTEIVSEESEVSGNEVTAMAPADVTYYVNDSQVEITDKENVKLLVDDVLDTQVLTDYIAGMEDIPAGEYLFAVQYLDLVDTSNGNAVVTMGEGQKMTLYWPVPSDADTAEPFYIVHFDALDRNYGTTEEIDGLLQANPPELYEDLKPISIGNQQYIKFETEAFSPFALVYEKDTGGSGPSRPTYYTLTYDSNGGTQYDSERYRRNTVVQLDKVPTREGYTFTGWYADKELTQAITEIKMTSNKTVYAGWEETDVPGMLNGEDHYAYVVGYEDGTVRPGGNISRAEVATIFFRLLQDQVRQENLTTDSAFADVAADDWYNTAISTMAELGILKGRTPDTFVPNAPITRAEFAAICARFDTGENAGGATFPDLAGHWAKEEVERAVSLGWIMGYEDNTFRPDKAITRAEAVTMINRVLQRNPQSPEVLLKDMVTWPDNQDPSQWYYLAIQEATNSHDYERTTGIYETWTQLRETPDWSQYE